MADTRHPDGGKPDLARIKAPGSPTAAASRIDYRSLLVKYIRHVWMETGLDTEGLKAFLAESERQMAAGAGITDTEWAELQRLAGEGPRG
jgi:hypothetical protein